MFISLDQKYSEMDMRVFFFQASRPDEIRFIARQV